MAKYFKGYDKESLRIARERSLQEFGTGRQPITDEYGRALIKDPDTGEYMLSMRDRYAPLEPSDYDYEVGIGSQIEDGVKAEYTYEFGSENKATTNRPVPLTVRPTTSSDYKRPYTVAAGWERYPGQPFSDSEKGTLSVMFRDGTLFNYYDVEKSFWIKFQGQISKGQFLNRNAPNPELNRYPHGPADISGVDQATQQYYRQTARRAQVQYRARTKTMTDRKPSRVTKQGQRSLSRRRRS